MKKISEDILDSSIRIHKTLGPGLLESVYKECLHYELNRKNILSRIEAALPVTYETLKFEKGFRADLIVENKIILEIKSVEKTAPVHRAQLLTYLKLTKYPLGFLINFGANRLVDGFHRFANGEEANDL